MDVLINYGFTIEEIHIIMENNNDIPKTDDKVLNKHIELLIDLNCTNNHIKNIIICNPFFLTNNLEEIISTIKRLKDYDFNHLNYLFDFNPYLLNINSKEIKNIYTNKEKEGLKKEEIIEYFNSVILL